MLNNSLLFWLFFLAVYLLYWFVLRTAHGRRNLLLVASAVFYASWDSHVLWVPLVLVYMHFRGARAIRATDDPKLRARRLKVTIAANLMLLVGFRYTGFIVDSIGDLLGLVGASASLPEVTLPAALGISYMTFAALSYTMDVYRGSYQEEPSYPTLLASIWFFPITVAGPIARPRTLVPQLDVAREDPDWQSFRTAVLLIALGLFKKTLADQIAVFLAPTLAGGSADSAMAWLVAIGGAVRAYADFSGYTDIAIGAAALLGITLPPNFNLPFIAASPVEFWRRWHISLSLWIRDYLYVSLGLRTPYRSLLIAWVLIGLWHGPTWPCVVWGLYNGLLIFGTGLLNRAVSLKRPTLRRLYPLRWLLTMYFWSLGCVVFQSPTLGRSWELIRKMHVWEGGLLYSTFTALIFSIGTVVVGHAFDAALASGYFTRDSRPALARWAVLVFLLIAFAFLITPGASAFIYGKF